jgi:hypothetical protein
MAIVASGNEVITLNSDGGTEWQVIPPKGVTISHLFKEDFVPKDYVPGIVP